MKLKHSFLFSLCISTLGLMSGCNDNDTPAVTPANTVPATSLRILHINDHHSHLQPNSATLTLAGKATAVKTGGFPRVVTKINELAASGGNVLKLHAGDALTGDLYFTLFKGKVDAEQMNQVCFDAFTLGNHEFDSGDAGLKNFLDFLNSSAACKTDVLSANVQPKIGTSPLTLNSATDYIKPYTIKEINGQKFGIIGLTIAGKTKNSSSPDETTLFANEATTAQKYIDELAGKGVNKIILLTHQGYGNDQTIAKQLKGVDVIVGGDSHTLLGDGFKAFGLTPSGDYPTKTTDANGKQVCIAQASQYSDIVGELNIEFDASGDVSTCSGTPHMLLSDTFKVNKVELTGAEREAALKVVADAPELSIVTSDATAQANLDSYSKQVDVLKQTKIGVAAETLCHERIPNQGLSKTAGCTVATKSNGSDIANIVSKAFLEMSLTSDICLQNAGGVRVDVPMGDITLGTAYTLLPFANTLTEMDMTGKEIVDSLEDGIDFALNPQGSTGSYPYAAGLRWEADLSQAKGARVTNVQINPRVKGTWTAIDPAKTYKVVTNSFLATGGDGYTTFKNLAASKKLNTYLDYAQSFADYVTRETAAGRSVVKLPLTEYSTQRFTDKDGILR